MQLGFSQSPVSISFGGIISVDGTKLLIQKMHECQFVGRSLGEFNEPLVEPMTEGRIGELQSAVWWLADSDPCVELVRVTD